MALFDRNELPYQVSYERPEPDTLRPGPRISHWDGLAWKALESLNPSIPPNSPYDLLLAEVHAIRAELDDLRERVKALEDELREAGMK